MFIRLPKPVELTPAWIKKNLKHQEPYFYYQLFDESENGPSEVPLGLIKAHDKKYLSDAPKLYIL